MPALSRPRLPTGIHVRPSGYELLGAVERPLCSSPHEWGLSELFIEDEMSIISQDNHC